MSKLKYHKVYTVNTVLSVSNIKYLTSNLPSLRRNMGQAAFAWGLQRQGQDFSGHLQTLLKYNMFSGLWSFSL